MRFSSILTVLCCVGALIITLITFFAGSNKTFIQNGELMTLNASRLGDGVASLFDDGISSLDNIINDAAQEIASALNVSDWYALHIMDYCKGDYSPNSTIATKDGAGAVSQNVTYCSPRSLSFSFNVTEIIQDSLPDGITLDDIKWPSEVTEAMKIVSTAFKAMTILYICGIIFAGLSAIGAIAGIVTNGRLSACGNWILDILGFLTIGAASGIGTALVVKAVGAINKYGKDIGVAATKGHLYLVLTWIATALMLVASCVSFIQLCVGLRDKRIPRNEKLGSY